MKSLRNDRDQLKKICRGLKFCAVAYPNDISGIDLIAEIDDCRSLVHMHDAITVPETPIDLLMFIVSYGDNVFPNFILKTQICSLVSAQQYVSRKTIKFRYTLD